MDKKIKRVNFYTIENIGNIQDITNFIYDELNIKDAFKIEKSFIKFNTLIQTYEYGKTHNYIPYEKCKFKYSFWTKYNNVYEKIMEYIKLNNNEDDINKLEIVKFQVYNNIKRKNNKINQQNNNINTNITNNNNNNTIKVNNTENNLTDPTDYSVLTDIGGGVKLHIIRPNKK
jgi:hypothetical protein